MKGKLFKKLTAGALALQMLGTALPPGSDFTGLFGDSFISASARGGEISGTCGENATWKYDSDTQTLTISGTGAMTDYDLKTDDTVAAPWYEYEITSVKMLGDITHIGNYAFAQLGDGFTSAKIPASVGSIGKYAFSSNKKLDSLSFEQNSRLTSVDSRAFSECTSLTHITFPDSIRTIAAHAFAGCDSMDYIELNVAPGKLSWADGNDDFKREKATLCYVPDKYLPAYNQKYTNVNVTFVSLNQCGDNAYYELEELGDDTYRLNIKGMGDMWDFDEENRSAPWMEQLFMIKEIVIGKDITRIGNSAFTAGRNQDFIVLSTA